MNADTIRLECLRLATLAMPARAPAEQVLERARAFLEFVRPPRPTAPRRAPRKARP
jgi:hypothetical protein